VVNSTIRWLYAPIMLIGVNGVAIWMIGAGAPIIALLPLALLAMVIALGAERVLPARHLWRQPQRDRARDVMHLLVGVSLITAGLVAAVIVGPRPLPGLSWPSDWPFVVQVIVAIITFDVMVTLVHVASHRWSLLWRFHAVHHSVRRLYALNGLVRHPVHQLLEGTLGALPLVAFGMPAEVGAVLALAVLVQLLLQHGNVDYELGPLERWLSLNRAHRLHHRAEPGEGDVNFGLFLLLWDRMLGTFAWEPRAIAATPRLGIGSRPDYPDAYVFQLIEPFRPDCGWTLAACCCPCRDQRA
jgi:sterol desaturase/sphingolipid hydroxylase (fatty acid hydroxylase superfamily)